MNRKGAGTISHSIIAAYGGDTVAAALAVAEVLPADAQLTVLVDYENDCVAHPAAPWPVRSKGRLWAVRLDTAGSNGGSSR